MSIDWITVSAQIINFLILVWLLKHFLYQPVLNAMDRREQRVTERLREADQREEEAKAQRRQFEEKENELTRQREQFINDAKGEAENQKQQLLNDAREKTDAMRRQWQHRAEEEKEEFLNSLQKGAAASIQSVSRKALRDLADASLEEQMIHVFIHQLASLDEPSRNALTNSRAPLRITTAFELNNDLRNQLTSALREHLRDEREVQFNHSPELLCGIRLTAGGQRLGWDLTVYLDELRNRVEQSFAPLESQS